MNPFLKLRDSLRPIHRPPAGGLQDAWIHHGFRAGLALLIALAVPWLFPRASLPEFDGIVEGEVADQSVVAAFEFDVPKETGRLRAQQLEAESAVRAILGYDESKADSSIVRIRALFSRLDSAVTAVQRRAVEDAPDPDERDAFLRNGINEVASVGIGTDLTDDQLDYLMNPGQRDRLRGELVAAFDGPLRAGVIMGADLANVVTPDVVIREQQDDAVVSHDEIERMEDFYLDAQESVTGRLSQVGAELFRVLLLQAEPTLILDSDAIRQAREQARNAVPRSVGFVMADERIVTANEVVGDLEIRRLEAYESEVIRRGLAGRSMGFLRGLGVVMLASCILGILVFVTYKFRLDIYEDLRSFTVLLSLILIVLAVSGVVADVDGAPALVPVAFAGLLAAALFDSLLGLVVVVVIAGVLLIQPAFTGLPAPLLAVAAGVTAAFGVGRVRTRSQSWVLIALITGAYAVAGLSLNLTGHYNWSEFGTTTLFGFSNAMICTAVAMGAVLPALEAFTGRTTEQSLLELADMNRPLLRRLSREAPGTYAHSINLANLVEAACDAIGADAVLGRVGAYYHDVGKLERPQYFIENQPKGLNPHDRLRPVQSAEILRAHVRDGLRMAEEARLPEVVKDFIREHHGTQQIRYFLHRAREEEAETDLDPNDFVYPGPKAQTKETAIAMLGDAVESASRTLASPSPEGIRALIETLANERVEHGEFDECGLTFRDLRRVKQEFAHVLTGLYHHRIDYPKPTAPPLPADPAGEAAASQGLAPAPPELWSETPVGTDIGASERRPPIAPTRQPTPIHEGGGSRRPD